MSKILKDSKLTAAKVFNMVVLGRFNLTKTDFKLNLSGSEVL